MTADAKEIIKRIRRVEIRTRRLVNESLAGEYHSMFKGRGMEFSEVREYQMGDDIRTIDWNVTARMGAPFVKKYVEERELTVHLLFDASGSGAFGSFGQRKREMAAEIAALLAFSAIKNNDKVGLIVFTGEVEKYIPPKKGREHVLRLIREILFFEPHGTGTNINEALGYLGRVSTKRSVVFILSDFFTSGYDRTLTILNRRHDIVSIAIRDSLEKEFPSVGLIAMRDLESGEEMVVDTSDRTVRRGYDEAITGTLERTRGIMKRADVDLLELFADLPYEKKLSLFFSARAKGIRKQERA